MKRQPPKHGLKEGRKEGRWLCVYLREDFVFFFCQFPTVTIWPFTERFANAVGLSTVTPVSKFVFHIGIG